MGSLRSSVVFIVDSQFGGGLAFNDTVNGYVSQFFGQLGPEDYFGYISLGGRQTDNLVLEKKILS